MTDDTKLPGKDRSFRERLLGTKLLVTLLAFFAIVLNHKLDLNIPVSVLEGLVYVLPAFIVGQAWQNREAISQRWHSYRTAANQADEQLEA